MDKKRLLELAGAPITEKDERDEHGTGMSDAKFALLKSEIRQTMEKLKRLQQTYRTETGRNYQTFV